LLAMLVVYLFLGNIRRTLIIGSAIPIAVLTTFIAMALGGLTLNIMTLGGLALGTGLLIDNTIVMLENIYRHQQSAKNAEEAAIIAATEVNSAIVASTTTSLSAVMPFLFIGGLVGLLFRELIFTISAANAAAMVVAITLVPALAAKVRGVDNNNLRRHVDAVLYRLQEQYGRVIAWFLPHARLVPAPFLLLLVACLPIFFSGKQIFLPELDNGQINVRVSADPGITLEEMDRNTRIIEDMLHADPMVATVYTIAGGSIFGRTQRETPSRSTINVQLIPLTERDISSTEWIKSITAAIEARKFAGMKVRMNQQGIRGIRTGAGDEDISLRVRGTNLETLDTIAKAAVDRLDKLEELRDVNYSSEEKHLELSIEIDRERANALGLQIEDIATAMRIALEGSVVTDFIEHDRSFNIRVRLPHADVSNPQDLQSILLFPADNDNPAIHLENVADIQLVESPETIMRDNQMRIVEISASLADNITLGEALHRIDEVVAEMKLPEGYSIYESGAKEALAKAQHMNTILLWLALFLVFVVMAVQYESLLNPLIIIISAPFAIVGVAFGLILTGTPLSMPVWLGIIMLIGIVVNNAIILVEYIDILREKGMALNEAIIEGGRLRLRPILMTTLTTVIGMLP
ncbi:MAG TPA: efflux RND transporter permease subunit, partial [Gammaproteobacteria bacterium]